MLVPPTLPLPALLTWSPRPLFMPTERLELPIPGGCLVYSQIAYPVCIDRRFKDGRSITPPHPSHYDAPAHDAHDTKLLHHQVVRRQCDHNYDGATHTSDRNIRHTIANDQIDGNAA